MDLIAFSNTLHLPKTFAIAVIATYNGMQFTSRERRTLGKYWMSQLELLAITCDFLKAREKSRVRNAISFDVAFHWL